MTEQPDVMTLSRLIRELQAIRRKRGDLRVYVTGGDDTLPIPVQDIRTENYYIADVGEREVVVIE